MLTVEELEEYRGVVAYSGLVGHIDAQAEEIKGMRELLKELEWEGIGWGTRRKGHCVSCDGHHLNHKPDCKLAAFLKEEEL